LPWLIEITNKGFSGVDLSDILNVLEVFGSGLSWAILELEAEAKPDWSRNMSELREQIARSPSGLKLSWSELVSLAEDFEQVINGVFVGVRKGEPIPTLPLDQGLYESSEIVIHAFDTTLWEVCARDKTITEAIQNAFKGTRLLEGPRPESLS